MNNPAKKIIWNIKKLESPKEFAGLGEYKTVNLPAGVIVLAQEVWSAGTLKSETIICIPGITGSESTKSGPEETSFLVEVANYNYDQLMRNNALLGNKRNDAIRAWSGEISLNLTELFWERMQEILEMPE